MVSRSGKASLLAGAGIRSGLVTLAAIAAIAWQSTRVQSFADLWLTADQQGRLAVERRDWKQAVDRFEDPAWKGVAAYRGGMYDAAAESFGRNPTAEGYFNRGDALMKAGDYRNAARMFELAVAASPEWREARDNLELARYTVTYVERTRDESDTGDDEEMSADEIELDNEDGRGREVEITRDSAIGLESAEKWMRAVDTDTATFLRTRFQLEAARETSR